MKITQRKEPEILSPFCTIAEAARRSGLSAFFIRKQVRDGRYDHRGDR